MNDLDLDAIRARAIAAGGTEASWRLCEPTNYEAMVQDKNDEVVVYDSNGGYDFFENRPTPEQAAHIAGMDPATTIALLDEIERLEKEPIAITAEMIEAGRVAIREEIGDPDCLSGHFLAENLAVAVYLAMLPASTQVIADEINRLSSILRQLGLGERFQPTARHE